MIFLTGKITNTGPNLLELHDNVIWFRFLETVYIKPIMTYVLSLTEIQNTQ